MRGVVFTGDRKLELMDFPDPEPGPTEVIVGMRASGMCGSDLHFYRMDPSESRFRSPFIQGHEPCGVIEAVGAGVPANVAEVGDRVMIHHYWGCGMCESCRSGWPQMCTTMEPRIPTTNEHGGHAQYMRIPAIQSMRLPDSLSFQAGAAIGCGVGTAWGGLVRAGAVSGKDVVVLGQGPVGASITMFASAMGARVIAVDITKQRLEQAKRFGADEVVNSGVEDPLAAVREYTRGRGPEVVLDTTGVSTVASQAIDMVARWGTVVYIGLGADVGFNTMATYQKQISMKTSWTLSTVEMLRCTEFIVDHSLPVDSLFTHVWKLDDAVEAYKWFDQQSDGKGYFEF